MRRTRTAATALAVALAASLAASPTAAADPAAENPLAEFHEQEVVWAPCEERSLSGLECAEIEVPLDHSDPEGRRITIAISRNAASDPEQRRGILLTNPGGPGGTGRHLALDPDPSSNLWGYGHQRVAEAYDIIGMDPRGSGASGPHLDCGMPMTLHPPRPDDSEFSSITRTSIAFQRGCERNHGDLLQHVTTAATARDMDVIRAALGEEKLNYIGASYGTYLGAVYGSLFPERLDRSVLDSSVVPDGMWRGVLTLQAEGYRRNVERYSEWLAGYDGLLGFGSTAEEVMETLDTAHGELEENPRYDIPGLPEGVPFTADDFDFYVGQSARYQGWWDAYTSDLFLLVHGLPFPDLELPEPAVPDIELSNDALMTAILCEAEWPSRLSEYYADMRRVREESPYGIGVNWHSPLPCTFASEKPAQPLVELERDGYPAGLVIAGEFDPQTVYEGGPQMADRLGHGLITVTDEGGHGFYGMAGLECVDDAVDAYLVDGAAPQDLTCAGHPRAELGGPATLSAQEQGSMVARVMESRDEVLAPSSGMHPPLR